MWLWKGNVATRTRDPGRGCAVVGGFVGGINGAGGHVSVAMVEGTVIKLAVPAVFEDVRGAELIAEAKDTVRAGFSGVKVVLGTFERGKLFDRKVFRELFDGEVGKIVRHSMCFSSADRLPFNIPIPTADCSFLIG